MPSPCCPLLAVPSMLRPRCSPSGMCLPGRTSLAHPSLMAPNRFRRVFFVLLIKRPLSCYSACPRVWCILAHFRLRLGVPLSNVLYDAAHHLSNPIMRQAFHSSDCAPPCNPRMIPCHLLQMIYPGDVCRDTPSRFPTHLGLNPNVSSAQDAPADSADHQLTPLSPLKPADFPLTGQRGQRVPADRRRDTLAPADPR